MQSPLDGYIATPVEDLRISVYSPPSKLYERLLSGRNVEELFSSYPTPIGTVFYDFLDYSREELNNPLVRGFQERKLGNTVTRNLVNEQNELASTRNNIEIEDADKVAVCAQQGLGPEFFGNHLLNDTSLVIKLEFWLGSQWFSLLFPGDLENWVYVIKRHQPNLYSDYFKVSHHGGRIFIGESNGLDQVFQAIRPTFSSISASGKHGLPHAATREALVRWSSSVFCSLHKGCERFRLDGNLPIQDSRSCRDTFSCQRREDGNTFTINSKSIETNKQACQRTYTPNSLPVIQFEQHFIPDSKILTNLSEREIDKHTGYIKKYLNEIYKERINGGNIFVSKPVSIEEIHTKLLQDNRYLTQGQIEQIFKHGYLKGEFWSRSNEYLRYDSWREAYKLPTNDIIKKMWALLEKKELLITILPQITGGASTILNEVSRDNFAVILEKRTAYPQQLIDQYVWPVLIPNALKYFNLVYVISHSNHRKSFLLLFRKSIKSFQIIIEKELKHAPFKLYSDYESDSYYHELYDKYAEGNANIFMLNSFLTTKGGNRIKFIDDLFVAFNHINEGSTNYRYDIISPY